MIHDGNLHIEGLRSAALELQALDNHEVVKVAGVFRKIKNWWKAFTSPEYREQVDALKDESAQVKHLLESLYKEIENLQTSINDTDVGSYEESLSSVREMSLELSRELAALRQQAAKADKDVPTEKVETKPEEPVHKDEPEIDLPRGATGFHQTEELRRDPKARATMFRLLPEGYDVKISDDINKKFSDFNWFKQVGPNQIKISLENWRSFMFYYKKLLEDKFKLAPNQSLYMVEQLRKDENIKQLEGNIKQAILGGVVKRNNLPKTQKDALVQKRPINQMDVVIAVEPFQIPGTTMYITAMFGFTDMMATGGHSLNLKWTQRMDYVKGMFDVDALPSPEMPKEEKTSPIEELANQLKEEKKEKPKKPAEKAKKSPAPKTPEAKKSKPKTEPKKEVKPVIAQEESVPWNVRKERLRNEFVLPPENPAPPAASNIIVPDDWTDHDETDPYYERDYDDDPGYWGDSDYATASRLTRLNELMKFAFSKTSAQVPKQKTVYRGIELANILRDGFRSAFGRDPTLEELGTGWAQSMTEQSGSYNNNNFGNVTATKGWIKAGNDYFVINTENTKPGGIKEFDTAGNVIAGLTQIAFRSYRFASDGAADYWRILGKNHGAALQWFGTGDALSAALALGDSRYYTANRKVYAGNMTRLFDKFMTEIAPKLGMQSRPSAVPEEKPEYKPYSKSEQVEEIPEDLQQLVAKHTMHGQEAKTEVPANDTSPLDIEYEQTMKQLFASSGPIEGFVRRALERTLLPNTSVLLAISSEEPHYVQVRYAQVLVSALRSELGAESSIHDNGKRLEIESDIAGSNRAVMAATQALADGISNAFEMATHGMAVKTIVWDGLRSSYGLLEAKTSEDSFRKFAFKVMNV